MEIDRLVPERKAKTNALRGSGPAPKSLTGGTKKQQRVPPGSLCPPNRLFGSIRGA